MKTLHLLFTDYFSDKERLIDAYNALAGTDYPDKSILKLSDAYLTPPGTEGAEGLELIVPVYNIAKGHNEELLKQSTALSDYAMFVSLVYDYTHKGDTLENAIEKTLYYCKGRGIMSTYLERQGAEVRNMLLTEWNDDKYREVIREEAIEEGKAEWLATGEQAEREKWQGVVADKDAQIAELKARLGEN